jgi:hypothetical protein
MGPHFRNSTGTAESWWEHRGLDMFSLENVAGFLSGARDATIDGD